MSARETTDERQPVQGGNRAGTDPQLVRERLASERERLQALLPETESTNEEASDELSSVDQHPAEIGTETFDREAALSLREQLIAELAELDAAEARLEDGTYGVCEACGRPIGAERLEALPATRFCVDDQQAAEAEAAAGSST